MANPEQLPQLSPIEHLELAVRGAIAQVESVNDQFTGCFEAMKEQTMVFAATMLAAKVSTDTAYFRTDEIDHYEGWLFKEPVRKQYKIPIWIIKEDEKYGGGKLVEPDRYIRRSEPNFIAVTGEGKPTMVTRYSVIGNQVHPQFDNNPSRFLNRSIFDKPGATSRILGELATDLKKAAENYARKG